MVLPSALLPRCTGVAPASLKHRATADRSAGARGQGRPTRKKGSDHCCCSAEGVQQFRRQHPCSSGGITPARFLLVKVNAPQAQPLLACSPPPPSPLSCLPLQLGLSINSDGSSGSESTSAPTVGEGGLSSGYSPFMGAPWGNSLYAGGSDAPGPPTLELPNSPMSPGRQA